MSRHLYPAAVIAAVLVIVGCGAHATAASAGLTVLPPGYEDAVLRPEPFWATAQGIILIAAVVIGAALVAAWRMSRSR
jgi:aspartate/methionine/tyrosine aminotransferase